MASSMIHSSSALKIIQKTVDAEAEMDTHTATGQMKDSVAVFVRQTDVGTVACQQHLWNIPDIRINISAHTHVHTHTK